MEITPDFAIAIVAALAVTSAAYLLAGTIGLIQWALKKGRRND